MSARYFVISLKKSADRRENISSVLRAHGVNFEIFDASYGVELTDQERALFSDEDHCDLHLISGTTVRVADQLTPSEMGCALSHLRLYQHIIDQGLEYAVVMEDDAQPHPDVFEAIEHLDCITEPWDIVNFSEDHNGIKSLPLARRYYFRDDKSFYFRRLGMRNNYLDARVNARHLVAVTALYVITAKACRRLIEPGYPVRLPSDYLSGMIGFNHLRTFAAWPQGHYYKEGGFESTIGAGAYRPSHSIKRIRKSSS